MSADEARRVIGEALDGVRGDFSRAQARDAVWAAVLPLLTRDEGLIVRPDDVVAVGVHGDEQPIYTHGRDIAVLRPAQETP